MPAPVSVLPKKKPNSLQSTRVSLLPTTLHASGTTNPPLNAPTGFRAGSGEASCILRAEVWKPRDAVGEASRRLAAGAKLRDAML